MPRPSRTSISLAGEFAVLSQLSLRGMDANMTLGHTKHVDILVSDSVSGKMYKLEAKTRLWQPVINSTLFGQNLEWHMSKKHEEIKDRNLFYCFVDIDINNKFKFFIISSRIVADYVKNQHVFWLKNRPGSKDNDMRIFRIGTGRKGLFPSVSANKYENNWEFKK